jgi:hypothetical protein
MCRIGIEERTEPIVRAVENDGFRGREAFADGEHFGR